MVSHVCDHQEVCAPVWYSVCVCVCVCVEMCSCVCGGEMVYRSNQLN